MANITHFSNEAAEYLLANGFTKTENLLSTDFSKNDISIMVEYNQLSVYREGKYKPVLLHSFYGFEGLDFSNYVWLFHITGALSIKEFKANMEKAFNPAAFTKSFFGKVKTACLVLIALITLSSFVRDSKNVLYMKTGTYTAKDGNITFEPNGDWSRISNDTTWRGFIIKKEKL